MKIAFDAQLLMKGEKTGIGWCAENILLQMPKNKKNTYHLNCFTLGYTKEQYEKISKYTNIDYKINKCTWFHDVAYRIIWSFFSVPYSLFFRQKVDITFFFNFVIPPGVKGKKITIIHDMAYKAYPETVRKKTKQMLDISLQKSCDRADKIITVSEFSKQEIIKYLNIDKDKIIVMPNGVNSDLYHPNYSSTDIENVKKKYKITKEYIFYLGTLEPRKNIDRLIQAYSELKNELEDLPVLVLAGRKGWMYDSIFETVINLGLEKDVIFTGYVESIDAPILLKGAEVFIFPSLYEGFGMPPLEAMACGTPVIVSNCSSLPEVVGDAGLYIDPNSINSIKVVLGKLINNKDIQTDLSYKGIERAKNYSWSKAGEIIQSVFEEI